MTKFDKTGRNLSGNYTKRLKSQTFQIQNVFGISLAFWVTHYSSSQFDFSSFYIDNFVQISSSTSNWFGLFARALLWS